MPTILSDDLLIEIFKFSDRFDINQNFEFVNVHWAGCILAVEQSHLSLYKMYKIWLCPLFCALHYTMQPTEDTILKEVFKDCSDSCRQNYLQFVSDEWPAQRIPFCMYTQKSLLDHGSLKKVTFNYNNWRIERPENAHFFYHFRDVCFEEAYLDVYNDRSLTLFLLDCPIFKLRTGHFTIRSTTEPLPFQRIVEFAQQKVVLPKMPTPFIGGQIVSFELLKELLDPANPIFEFILTGRDVCSELALEAHQFQMLFDLIEEYKDAYSLCHAIPVVRLTVPPYGWHQRTFIEGTLCDSFHTSQQLGPLIHQFGFFDAFNSAQQKFTCNVHFNEDDLDKIEFYEFRIG